MTCKGMIKLFALVLAISLLAACGASQPQAKLYRIGIASLVNVDDQLTVVKQTLADAGYIEGQNVTYIYSGPAEKIENLAVKIRELRDAQVDIILAMHGVVAIEAQKQLVGADTPVIFIAPDPLRDKLVASLTQPGGTFTGVTIYGSEAKRVEWLHTLAPASKHLFFPYDSSQSSARASLIQIEPVAKKLGLELIAKPVTTSAELDTVLKNVPADVDGILIARDLLVQSHIAEITKLALDRKIPISSALEANSEGVLMAFMPDNTATAKQAARLLAKVLGGAKPADIPVETAEFVLAINLRTANAIGLKIADEHLRQAGQIIR